MKQPPCRQHQHGPIIDFANCSYSTGSYSVETTLDVTDKNETPDTLPLADFVRFTPICLPI